MNGWMACKIEELVAHPLLQRRVFMSADMTCSVPHRGSAHTDPRIVRIYEGQQVAIGRDWRHACTDWRHECVPYMKSLKPMLVSKLSTRATVPRSAPRTLLR